MKLAKMAQTVNTSNAASHMAWTVSRIKHDGTNAEIFLPLRIVSINIGTMINETLEIKNGLTHKTLVCSTSRTNII